MYRWGLPVGCLFLVLALLAALATMSLTGGAGVWAGAGVAGLFLYLAVMCVHYFELADSPGRAR